MPEVEKLNTVINNNDNNIKSQIKITIVLYGLVDERGFVNLEARMP